MNRREFIAASAALAASSICSAQTPESVVPHGFPADVLKSDSYVELTPVAEYRPAPAAAYEAFQDMKFGVRIHWGIYSIWHRGAESWPFLPMPFEDRQRYNSLYQTWNPAGFDATEWVDTFAASGMKMFAFTSKHHEGFSMFDTKTRVKSRANWTAPGGPRMEACDLAYSIMETPFRRDVIKELTDAAHRRGMKIDLYFSHPDWYDADFRPYVTHPLQVPSAAEMQTPQDIAMTRKDLRGRMVIVPNPSEAEVKRMMARHRAQLVELLTNYGTIDMLGLDMWLGPRVWPEMRATILKLREIQPNVMLRHRGIGNYGDYYTPERVVPGVSPKSDKPWFTIYPLGSDFSYEPDAAKYKGTEWIVHNLADTVAKGGGLMVGVGPSAEGAFHPEAVRQMKETGAWLKVNGEAIYATRPRDGALWAEGDRVRFTRTKDRRFTYAILTEWPGMSFTLKPVRPRDGSTVRMLGFDAPIAWTFDAAKGTTFALPEKLQQESNRPCKYAWSFRMEGADGTRISGV
jgi:alpha-L-fucosidase